MLIYKKEIDLFLRYAIIIDKLFYYFFWAKIEQKIEIKAYIVAKIIHKAIEKIENENFHDVLACVKNIKGRDLITRILDDLKLSSNIRNVFLKHSYISFTKVIFNKENINILEIRKCCKCMLFINTQRSSRAFLERV